MSRAKSSPSPPPPPPSSLQRHRPSAIRSSFLFPLATSTTLPSATSASPLTSPTSLGGQSRLSIRPFDIRDSDTDDRTPPSPPSPSSPLSLRRRSQIYQVSCAAPLHPTASDPGYSVAGLGTSGFTYSTRERRHPPQPLSEEDRMRWKEVAPEDALRALGLDYAHSLRVKLKPSTRTKLTLAMRREVGEVDRTVLRLCSSGQLTSKCGVYHILDNNTTPCDHQYTLVTKQPLLQYEPVIAVIGTLRERESYEAWCDGHHAIAMLHAIDIDPAEMPSWYQGPDLLLDTAHYTNEVRFLRDPRFSHRNVEANVEARLVWHHQLGLPYVVFVTLQAMPAGVELWKRWDVDSREVAWRVQMKYAAKRSHCQHHYIGQLQDAMRKHGLPLIPPRLLKRREDRREAEGEAAMKDVEERKEAKVVGAREYIPFSWRQSESWTLHHVCAQAIQEATTRENRRLREKRRLLREMQTKRLPLVTAAVAASMEQQEDAARKPAYDFALLSDDSIAYAASNCTRRTHNDWSMVGKEVTSELEPKYRQNEREATRLTEDVKLARRTGLVAKAAIHRIISLHHPARFYAPPPHPSFALVATQPMRRAACIGAYVGVVRTLNDYNSSCNPFSAVYTYNLDPLGLDLVIDSLPAGNALRFMNDCFARSGGPRTCNAQPRFLFDADTRKPNCFILCTAKQGIRKGEEVVTDYGRAYWSRICRALLSAHGRYGDQARLLIEGLVRELRERGLEVPVAKEWREVKEEEFREGWVVYPEFAKGEDGEGEGDDGEDDEEKKEERERWQAEEEEQKEGDATLAVKLGPGVPLSDEGLKAEREGGVGRSGRGRGRGKRRKGRLPPWTQPKRRRTSGRLKKMDEGEEEEMKEEKEQSGVEEGEGERGEGEGVEEVEEGEGNEGEGERDGQGEMSDVGDDASGLDRADPIIVLDDDERLADEGRGTAAAPVLASSALEAVGRRRRTTEMEANAAELKLGLR